MPEEFTAKHKPRESRPDKPILLSRGNSQTRVSIKEAKKLRWALNYAIEIAELAERAKRTPVGTKVKLNQPPSKLNHSCPEGRDNHRTAHIVSYIKDYGEGAVMLDRDLHGCRFWNIEVLEAVD